MSLPDRRDLIADAAISTVASAGLRGLTHRAVDTAAGLPAGSTSYYFRTRSALISACYLRLAELTVADVDRWQTEHGGTDPDSAAEALAVLLHHWLTAGRDRQLARFELSLEATRRPELRADLETAGLAARSRATTLLAALGASRPAQAEDLLVALDRRPALRPARGRTGREPPGTRRDRTDPGLRRMLAAVLAA
ncbi:TetR family transcriptional regulator [Streptomyces sp. MT29]|nr:TetR family transcriptional regulator [Streptomyces sp. MT29]